MTKVCKSDVMGRSPERAATAGRKADPALGPHGEDRALKGGIRGALDKR